MSDYVKFWLQKTTPNFDSKKHSKIPLQKKHSKKPLHSTTPLHSFTPLQVLAYAIIEGLGVRCWAIF